MKFFTSDDFAENEWVAIPAGQAANIANAKLEREAKVVYGQVVQGEFLWNHTKEFNDTHTGILICIEEIEKPKCEHEAKILVGTDNCYVNECIHCGVKLKAMATATATATAVKSKN